MPQHRKSIDQFSPEQRARIEAFRARHRTEEARARERAIRAAVQEEFPPAVADPSTQAFLNDLKRERERQGLSLSDLAERTGIDRATLSKLENGKQPNPTLQTLRKYAAALGRQIELALVDSGASR